MRVDEAPRTWIGATLAQVPRAVLALLEPRANRWQSDDDALLRAGMEIFEALYQSLSSSEKPIRAKRRGTRGVRQPFGACRSSPDFCISFDAVASLVQNGGWCGSQGR